MAEYNDNDKYWIGEVLTKEDVNEIWQHILDLLRVNGGEGSEINADMLDGHHASYFASKDELANTVMQPGFYIGKSPLLNKRNLNEQYLLTTDILPSEISGASSSGIIFPQTEQESDKYSNYFKFLLYNLYQYQKRKTNLDDGTIEISSDGTPINEGSSSDSDENPDMNEKIYDILKRLIGGYSGYNSDSGGWEYEKDAEEYPLTKILNDIIVSIWIDSLVSSHHDDRLSQIEKLLNINLSESVKDMLEHIMTYNYGEVEVVSYEEVDGQDEPREVRTTVNRLNADSVNGIQLILITQSDYDNLPDDMKNSWRYLYIIKEDGNMPGEGEQYTPGYVVTGSTFNLLFRIDNSEENSTWLQYAMSYKNNNSDDNSVDYRDLIPIVDLTWSEGSLSPQPIITKDLLKSLLKGEYVENNSENITNIQEKIIDIISRLPSESGDFDSIYQKIGNMVQTLNNDSTCYPSCSAVMEKLEDYHDGVLLDELDISSTGINSESDDLHYPSSKAVYNYAAPRVHEHDNYVLISDYETDLKALGDSLRDILGA